ncbi:MAG: hypothetical protein QNK25_11155 [Desulfobacterales bacterium]|nr:hypothetical protein [Desulfobacterales bacterium]
MKTRITATMLLLACLSLLPIGWAQMSNRNDTLQEYIDTVRLGLLDGKVGLINGVMKLSDEDAEVFWPLYVDYETELFDIGDRRVALIERIVAAHQSKVLEDLEAKGMAAEWLTQETDRLGLLKKYHVLIADELSPLHAIQFLQIEHRVNTVIDLMIASELPLFLYGELTDGLLDPSEKDPETIPIKSSWQGDYPVDALSSLPADQRAAATGYIADAETFAAVWRVFQPAESLPQIDFKQDLVLFARNTNFYNRTRIGQVQVTDGALQVLAIETMSAAPIEDKVAMALAVISRKGAAAIQLGERRVPLLMP